MNLQRPAERLSSAVRALRVLAHVALLAPIASCPSPGTLANGEEFVLLPSIVAVQPAVVGGASSFRLEVVSRGVVGNPTDPEPLVWTASDPGVVIVPDHAHGTAQVTLPVLPAGSSIVITATNGTRAATSMAMFRMLATGASDEARDDLVDGGNPSVILTSGDMGGTCAYDRVAAFNGSAPIGAQNTSASCDRADAAIFSEGGAPKIVRPAGWTSLQDIIDASGNGGPIIIPTMVVIGVEDAAVPQANVDEDNFLLTAGDTYRFSRSGIAIPTSAQTRIREKLATVMRCADVATLPSTVTPDPTKLNIYHVTSVVDVDGTIQRGYFCTPNVILVAHGMALDNTFAHELGHALGLISPYFGHIDGVSGFIRDNVMSTDAATGQDDRHRLSLGQLFRMHVDGRSWLRRNSDLTDGPFTCSCDPYSTKVCPALSADLRPLLVPLPAAGAPCP